MTAQEVLGACNKVEAELRAGAADRPLRIGVLRTLPSAQLARLIENLTKRTARNADRTRRWDARTIACSTRRPKVACMYLFKIRERAGAALCRATKGRLWIGGQPQPSLCLLRKRSVIRSQQRALHRSDSL